MEADRSNGAPLPGRSAIERGTVEEPIARAVAAARPRYRDDRDACGRAFTLAEALGHLEPVEIGQHHVEQHEIGPTCLDRRECCPPGRHPLDLEAVDPERHRHQFGDVLLVVDSEDVRLRGCRIRQRGYSLVMSWSLRTIAAQRLRAAGPDRRAMMVP